MSIENIIIQNYFKSFNLNQDGLKKEFTNFSPPFRCFICIIIRPPIKHKSTHKKFNRKNKRSFSNQKMLKILLCFTVFFTKSRVESLKVKLIKDKLDVSILFLGENKFCTKRFKKFYFIHSFF